MPLVFQIFLPNLITNFRIDTHFLYGTYVRELKELFAFENTFEGYSGLGISGSFV